MIVSLYLGKSTTVKSEFLLSILLHSNPTRVRASHRSPFGYGTEGGSVVDRDNRVPSLLPILMVAVISSLILTINRFIRLSLFRVPIRKS